MAADGKLLPYISQCVIRGRRLASSGKSHSCDTATSSSIKPKAPTISVAAGSMETVRTTATSCVGHGRSLTEDREAGLRKEPCAKENRRVGDIPQEASTEERDSIAVTGGQPR